MSGYQHHSYIVLPFSLTLINAGVVWPSSFANALNAMSILSFDFSVMSGLFCMVNMSFYANLLSSTMLLTMAVIAIFVRAYIMRRRTSDAKRAKKIWQDGLFVVMYVLLFAYPVVSVRVVETFSCHDVEGVRYLRADYSIQVSGLQV